MSSEQGQPENFVGLTEEQATILAQQQGLILRVTRRDEVDYMQDRSLRTDRVNIQIEERIVISAEIG